MNPGEPGMAKGKGVHEVKFTMSKGRDADQTDSTKSGGVISEFIRELNLSEKLLPHKNGEIAWVWIFLPVALGYITILMHILNTKPTIGSISVFSESQFGKIARTNYPIEVLTTGGAWTEGPMWINEDESMPYLLYSDVIQNKINRWEEGRGFFTVGKTLHLSRSGCKRDDMSHCDSFALPGSNGLAPLFPSREGFGVELVMCQHGERAITLQRDNGTRTILASHYKGKRLNSPNDLVWTPEGHLYFTDPTYGLLRKGKSGAANSEKWLDSSLQEIPHAGVYMIHRAEVQKAIETGKPADNIFLIDSKMTHPNGLAFSPGYSKLYVSNSDPKNAHWKVFDVNSKGLAHKGRLFYNATSQLAENHVSSSSSSSSSSKLFTFGNPDGLKVDISGNIYATGPGGVLVISPEGQLIGRLETDRPVSNVAWGDRGYLYMTAEDLVLRKRLNTKPPKGLERPR